MAGVFHIALHILTSSVPLTYLAQREGREPIPGSVGLSQGGALGAAIAAFPLPGGGDEVYKRLWLTRVCKTASHELGHCFGFDHCTYLACIMQSTSCLAEDARQPPYLCAICEVKLACAKRELHVERRRCTSRRRDADLGGRKNWKYHCTLL